jgi:hypothetical protein
VLQRISLLLLPGEGRSIRSDSNRPPIETQPGPHGGTGAVHTGSTRMNTGF